VSEGPGRVCGAVWQRVAPPAPPGPSLTLGVTERYDAPVKRKIKSYPPLSSFATTGG
jgi:hypothetical protein